ncbi:MAG: bifunctional folylpolyglutamate synthase/dihydrofolate synthase, partial [Rhodospirillaceae bacterium]
LVFGMLSSKRPTDFIAPLARHAETLLAVPIPGEPAALTAEAVAQAALAAGLAAARPCTGPAEALTTLAAARPAPCRVLICGSLYLAGSVLAENG